MTAVAAAIDALESAGMTADGRALASRAFDEAARTFTRAQEKGVPAPLFVPGRIEVLGKHTDYAGGSTLTCAVERGVCAFYAPRDDGRVCVVDALSGDRVEFAVAPDLEIPFGHWSNYPMTVVKRLARNFGVPLRGVTFVFRSTLPSSAGLSSSSAIITSVFHALAAVNDLPARDDFQRALGSRLVLAGYLGSVENGQTFGALTGDRGVGTFGGSEDHAAMLCSRPGHLWHFAFCPVRPIDCLRVPDGLAFVVATSGIVASKTGNARDRYNRASLLARYILDRWRTATRRPDESLAEALHSDADAPGQLEALLRAPADGAPPVDQLLRRLEHFRYENDTLLPEAVAALQSGDITTFGRVSDESQRAAETLLGNQVPETIALARLAREGGAHGASAFGAGFGGSVWALVTASDAATFSAGWQRRYRATVPANVANGSVFFVTAAGPAATPPLRLHDE